MNSKKPRRACLNCSKEVKRPIDTYCNNTCQHQFEFNEREKKVLESGDVSQGWGGAVGVKNFLVYHQGQNCSVCGITEWCGQPVPLVMDHIDGNSNNWLLVNLRLVCGNCDMQLPTYKSKNRGNGRHFRTQRRNEGKSY